MTPEQAAQEYLIKTNPLNDSVLNRLHFHALVDIIHLQRAEAVAEAIGEVKAIWRRAGDLWCDAFKNSHNILSCDNCGYVDISIDDYLVCPNRDCTEELVNPQKVGLEHLRHHLLSEYLFPEYKICSGQPAPQEGE